MSSATTLILGIGNPLLTDDGVGVHVVRRLGSMTLPADAEVAEAAAGGLGILELIEGFRRLVVIDAIDAGAAPGTVLVLGRDDLACPPPLHLANPHETDLLTVIETGRLLGITIPEEIVFVAVQIADVTTIADSCTPEVAVAIDHACSTTLDLLRSDRR